MWVYVCTYMHVCVCVYICVQLQVDYRYVYMSILDISACVCWMCVTVFHAWATHPLSLSGDGGIKLSCKLKDFNFIIKLFKVTWRHTIWQYFYVQSIGGPKPESRKYSPLHIYKWSSLLERIHQGETKKVMSSLKSSLLKELTIYAAKVRTPHTL